MNKKETVLSVLKEIRDILKKKEVEPLKELPNSITIDFPSLTAQQMVEDCDNKVDGGKLLYNTSWYEKEAFYTTEKTRKGTRTINAELLYKGKSWNECKDIADKEGLSMLNFAEVIWLLKTSKEFRELLTGYNWTWTSSRSSYGYLVDVGRFDSYGADVYRRGPGYSGSDLGVCFSRS